MRDLKRISKKLAYILRHNPKAFGIELDNEGWVSISEIEAKAKIKRNEILQVVKTQRKKRFEIKGGRIRALYGHTCIRLKYQPVEPPDVLYHGTSPESAERILKEGLKPMKRQYVHLSRSVDDAIEVGRRHAKRPFVLKVRAREAYKKGIPFYLAGDTYLAPYVPPEFIEV